jgi:hypothetical protein
LKHKAPGPPAPVDGETSTKRTKTSEPGGLVPNWKQSAGITSHITKKRPIESKVDDDIFTDGEFDTPEPLATLEAIRASKPAVKIDSVLVSILTVSYGFGNFGCSYKLHIQIGTKFTACPIYRTPNNTRPKGVKVVVDDLPFPHPRTPYNAKWQKVFRPTLICWASTYADPYGTNTELDETVVLDMWDIIYPDITLDKEKRIHTGIKLVYLVCVLYSMLLS